MSAEERQRVREKQKLAARSQEMDLDFRILSDGRLAALGYPGRLPEALPETGSSAHNCDRMGCGSSGPHIIAFIRLGMHAEKMLRRFVRHRG